MKYFAFILFAAVMSFSQISPAAKVVDYSIDAGAYQIEWDLRLYEICGKVTGPKVDGMRVEIIADPNKKNSGHYGTTANPEGKFCQVVRVAGNKYTVVLPDVNKTMELTLKK